MNVCCYWFRCSGTGMRFSNRKEISGLPLLNAGFSNRLNARWQTHWAIKDLAKKFKSTARPYDQRAFSSLDPTAVGHSHLALAIYMFVVVNFDALAQASHLWIGKRKVVFLCWLQDSIPDGLQQAECPLTNRLSYRKIKLNNLNSTYRYKLNNI